MMARMQDMYIKLDNFQWSKGRNKRCNDGFPSGAAIAKKLSGVHARNLVMF